MGTEVTEVVERKTPLYDTHVKYKGKIVPVCRVSAAGAV